MAGAKGPHGFPLPGKTHLFFSKFLGASMAFWILYRGKKEMPILLGLRHPWEHHDHDGNHTESHH